MAQRIAVAIVHGIGNQKPTFADETASLLRKEFVKQVHQLGVQVESEVLAIEPVYWAPIVQKLEDSLWNQLGVEELRWDLLRKFIISYLGDAIAYQITPTSSTENGEDKNVYAEIHDQFRRSLSDLALQTNGSSPLCVIAHSLGTIITSNFFYDLQQGIARGSSWREKTPLENGETLTHLFTIGSPIPLWSLKYKDFGIPVQIPSPKLPTHYPNLEGEWLNFYDKDDLLGYPLKPLNDRYRLTVKEDIEVNSGGYLVRMTPLSHMYYWNNHQIITTIAKSLAKLWVEMGTEK